ncbi:TPA: hypothetical protein QCX18_005315 [Bacillus wiedmannii]|uniref:hypothetical protein n=1 Tax=Acinetobacter sp. HRXRD-152 TaxID=3404808 RepID=UPI003834DCD1|nr:hypothetical protein [Bacillus wiedmannii]
MNTDKLINKILLSSNDDLIVFIDEYFICNEKLDDFSYIKEREKDLLKLDEDVLNYALFRLESLEEIYDSSKGSTAGTNLMGVISAFFLKDYVPIFINPKLHPNLYIFCQLVIFMIVIYFLSKLLRNMDKKSGKKSKVIYFRKLLEYVLKEKTR